MNDIGNLFEDNLDESETEKASNAYLMSLVVVMVGAPFPIINALATSIFYIANRKSTYFVRWHCTQSLLSQISIVCINTAATAWTLSIVFGPVSLSNSYIGYILSAIIFNIIEFIASIYAAIRVRKGVHVEWWFYGDLTNKICKVEL